MISPGLSTPPLQSVSMEVSRSLPLLLRRFLLHVEAGGHVLCVCRSARNLRAAGHQTDTEGPLDMNFHFSIIIGL